MPTTYLLALASPNPINIKHPPAVLLNRFKKRWLREFFTQRMTCNGIQQFDTVINRYPSGH